MKNSYLVLVLVLCFFQSFAQQNNFYVTERFLEGEKIKLFSQNRGAAVVLLEDHTIYLMNKELQFTDISNHFEPAVLEDISSVESVNENIFLLGTHTNSLFMYEDGEVTNLKDANPDLPNQINSIDYRSSNYTERLLLATNDSLWVSNDLRTYERSDFEFSANPKFYGGRNSILLESLEYFGCYDVESEYSIFAGVANGTLIHKIFQNEGFDIDKLNDVEYGRYTGSNGFYGMFAFYAAHNGLYAQSIGECNFDTAVHITDLAVYDLEVISNQGVEYTPMFAASDNGLMYSEADDRSRFDVYGEPNYYPVQGIDTAYTIDYSIFHNTIWVGTNNGLVQVQEDDLIQDSLEPDPIEFDTLDFCQNQGVYLDANIHSQLDKQWYRNGEVIPGAISSDFHAEEEALYSIQYEFEDSIYYYDVAYTRLENEFNETIDEREYLICADDYNVWLRIDDKNYPNHEYSWYSVERGLEFETANASTGYFYAEDAGNYYFIATNCNGFTYHSDTVLVEKSSLGDEYFSVNSAENLCAGDTVFIENSDAGVDFEWDVDYSELDGYNESFLVLKAEYSNDNLRVRMTDELGCSQNLYAGLGTIYPLPALSEGQEEIYICEDEDFVYLDLQDGLTLDWAGYSSGEFHKVPAGVYPVTVSNGFCEDFEGEVEVKYYDPFPMLNFEDTVVQVDDTFKIPVNGNSGINWEGEIKMSSDRSFLYVSSDKEESLQAELWLSNADCEQRYSFTVVFEGPSILSLASQETAFTMYPNPAKGGVTVANPESGITEVQILALDGRVLTAEVYQNQTSVFVDFPDHLEAGTYLLRIIATDNRMLTKKVIIE